MGLFGGQTKVPDQLEERYAAEEQEEMPQLPEPHTNTVIAKDLTVNGTLRGDGVVQIGPSRGRGQPQGLCDCVRYRRYQGAD